MPNQDERREHEAPGNAAAAALPTSNAALASRFNQMFPVLSAAEIDRVRRFGEVTRFPAGDLLFQAGETYPGMYVILSGRVAVVPHDVLGKTPPVEVFAHLVGAPVEEMMEVVPGEVMGELGHLSGRPELSPIDARALDDVEAILIPPEALRATGAEVASAERVPLPLETGVEGIFAVGDVRCGSVKRVGAAIGEGAAVVAQLHTFFARRGSARAAMAGSPA
jgi:thioredoxin reductase (NADPH)